MTVTSIDIDPNELKQAKALAGTSSNRETVDLALKTLIAVRRQPAAVERIIARRFEADQIDAPTVAPVVIPPEVGPKRSKGSAGAIITQGAQKGRIISKSGRTGGSKSTAHRDGTTL